MDEETKATLENISDSLIELTQTMDRIEDCLHKMAYGRGAEDEEF